MVTPNPEPTTPDAPTFHVYLNGRMLPPEEATVSLSDAGLTHAVGLFETMACRSGNIFRLAEHLQRLANSAKSLGLVRTLDPEPLAQAVNQTISHNRLHDARVRLTLTAGALNMLAGGEQAAPPRPTLAIVPTPPTQYDPGYFESGVKVLVAPPALSPFDPMAGHKTLSYWGRLRTLRQAATAGAGEAIWMTAANHIAGGAISNIFLVKDGTLLTPFARGEESEGALPAPVLPGITRAAVIQMAENAGLPVKKRMLTIDDLLGADEVFLTNSSWHILPVTSVEKSAVGEGKVGQVTNQLRTALLSTIERETSGNGQADSSKDQDAV